MSLIRSDYYLSLHVHTYISLHTYNKIQNTTIYVYRPTAEPGPWQMYANDAMTHGNLRHLFSDHEKENEDR